MKARTARDCASTVYIQILNLEDLKRAFRDVPESKRLDPYKTYADLKDLSSKFMEIKYSSMRKAMRIHAERSTDILNWLARARTDRAQKLEAHNETNIDQSLNAEYIRLAYQT